MLLRAALSSDKLVIAKKAKTPYGPFERYACPIYKPVNAFFKQNLQNHEWFVGRKIDAANMYRGMDMDMETEAIRASVIG